MRKISKFRWGISIIVLLVIGSILYSGVFLKDVLKIGGCYAIALGIIEIIYTTIDKNKKKNQ